MRVDLFARTADLVKYFDAAALKQVPFALMKTINSVVLEAQVAQRGHQRRVFTVRRPDFADRAVKIGAGGFATKQNLRAVLGYMGPQGDIFAKFQFGGFKRAPSGARLWVPREAKRSGRDIITKGNRPKGLNLRPVLTSTRTGTTVYKGDKRTFMLRKRDGSGVVLQRMARAGRDTTRTLFVYLRSDPKLPATLKLFENVQSVVERRFTSTFTLEFVKAMASAR